MTAQVIPLRPGYGAQAHTTDPVKAVFGPGGALSRSFSGYQPRAGQIALAEAVRDTIAHGGALLAEGPCGTGKSLAYLAPAAAHAVATGCKVVVATANIGLQEQLVQKDLPALARATGLPLRFALLKGRSNYVCKHLTNHGHESDQFLSPEERTQLQALDRWARNTRTGDRAELPLAVTDGVWRLRSVDREDCLAGGCEWQRECFAAEAKARAEDAHILVVNDHLLFAHLAVRMECGSDVVLPKWDVLILDEAHEAADIARDFFGATVTEGGLRRVARWLDREAPQGQARGGQARGGQARGGQDGSRLAAAGQRWWREVAALLAPRIKLGERTLWLRGGETELGLIGAAMELADALSAAGTLAGRAAKELVDRAKELKADGDAEGARETTALARKAEAVSRRATRAAGTVQAAMCAADREDLVLWLTAADDRRGGQRYTLEERPLDVATMLAAQVWGRTRAVIATSATLTTGEGPRGWDWIKGQLGAPAHTETLAVPSPFDFGRQALLCVTDGPSCRADGPGFERHVAETLASVVDAARGRTLGLFTSHRVTQATRTALAGRISPLLVQNDAPRSQLIARFREDPAAVLLGTASLWTGLDVQGEACVGVVIDKLPFPPPGEPVMAALCARAKRRTGDEWTGFREELLPRAVLRLRQGAGRLIRTVEDWGVVVICDGRLWSARYGPGVLRALGFPRVTRSLEEATAWLRERLDTELVAADGEAE